MAQANEKPEGKTVPAETKYPKERFLKSSSFSYGKDLISAILDDNTSYTKAEAISLIEKYLKGKEGK